MIPIESRIDPSSDAFASQRAGMQALIDRLHGLEQRAVAASERSRPTFARRGALLPRERVGRLLDPGAPFLPLSTLAGFCMDDPDPETSVPGGSLVAGIGFVCGVRCMVLATDSGIDAGAMTEAGNMKLVRCQEIALENRLPFIHLVESAGANLRKYRVDKFVRGGAIFYNLARLSAAGLPVITVVHGSSTAGGAYMPGLSDYVVMVRNRARAFLAGPPLLKAATGEIATDEELGGADLHATTTGLAEYLAEDDEHAIATARDIVASLDWPRVEHQPAQPARAPRLEASELDGVMTLDMKRPVDMREVIARIVDDSAWLPFKPDYGPGTVCGHARIEGNTVGFITNNGPIDPAGATKAAQFIQLCNQSGTPIVFLQNTTGFIVGRASEEAGMIKHGSKMIQALSNSRVPQVTLYCGASFGAGNFGMCGRGFKPRFCFSWPNARTAVMGGEQAAMTLEIVARQQAARKGKPVDEAQLAGQTAEIVANFERQASAFVTSGLLLDDGVIDPRDTRAVLAFVLATAREAALRQPHAIQFGVGRF
ncbi:MULTISPECIES: acyl-CoA carboxylase subunit beta [unclassified Cupriavidus]|uniref:acyl-CoA carboxylase subunit beta n=1 Tax=unclassified Cupriavidus TaxID=2640874 RepID=UPI000409C5F0|nr:MULTISPECIES: carboxyl transferase domain-containing protein [unclassified Cupriavidus]MBP0627718.1 acyl-CoA carboxylase subunit beta [Cupriavidus sp. AcVe19-1a]MBP0635542.1 acyl-CoA carboxylase subunit beta [Cupriavidus sp. AcVe19-6a]